MLYRIVFYKITLAFSIILSSCTTKESCNIDSENFEYAGVLINDFFSYYPLGYGDRTYIDTIDEAFHRKKYSQIQPNHNYIFENCLAASIQAEKDFFADRPSLIQFNGIVGEFPYMNEVYKYVIGVHIENTGCYLYLFVGCYNDKMWELLNDKYQLDVAGFLSIIDSLERKLVVDLDTENVVVVDNMPTIKNLDFGKVLPLGVVELTCRYEYILLGRFILEVRKNGRARVMDYVEGSLDCECVERMSLYFEKSAWQPAVVGGDTINSIVQIQFMN